MLVTVNDITLTEEKLTKYYKDMRVLRVWQASAINRKEHVARLEERIENGFSFNISDFSGGVGSAKLLHARPANRPFPQGLESGIDRAYNVYEKLLNELDTAMLDISVTEETIVRLEREVIIISEVMKNIDKESSLVLEMKLDKNKSFENIGDEINKSKTAVRAIYKNSITDVCKWLRYIGRLYT